jgi:translation initiation factor 1A
MSRKKDVQEQQERIQQEISRVKLPRQNQCFGIVEQRLGGTRMRVRCLDGNSRICRVPGRMKRKLWIREGDTVLVEPWELSGAEKGDIIFKYSKSQIEWLKQRGHLKDVQEFEEF